MRRGPISSGARGREFESPRSDQHLAQIRAPTDNETDNFSQVVGCTRARRIAGQHDARGPRGRGQSDHHRECLETKRAPTLLGGARNRVLLRCVRPDQPKACQQADQEIPSTKHAPQHAGSVAPIWGASPCGVNAAVANRNRHHHARHQQTTRHCPVKPRPFPARICPTPCPKGSDCYY